MYGKTISPKSEEPCFSRCSRAISANGMLPLGVEEGGKKEKTLLEKENVKDTNTRNKTSAIRNNCNKTMLSVWID